jgi:hypothetical protein
MSIRNRDKVRHDLDALKVARAALLSVAALIGVPVVAAAIVAAVHGRTVDPTDPVNYPRCSTAGAGHACQSP